MLGTIVVPGARTSARTMAAAKFAIAHANGATRRTLARYSAHAGHASRAAHAADPRRRRGRRDRARRHGVVSGVAAVHSHDSERAASHHHGLEGDRFGAAERSVTDECESACATGADGAAAR